MTDNDVTLPEVYRTLLALKDSCERGFSDAEKTQHSLRNRMEAVNLRTENINTRLRAVESQVKDLADRESPSGRDQLARFSGLGAMLGAAAAAFYAWMVHGK